MKALLLGADGLAEVWDGRARPAQGLIWLDVEREESGCEEGVSKALGGRVHDRHLADLRNTLHAPFFDGTAEYDLLILRGHDRRSPHEEPQTQPFGFLVTPTTVVSVHPAHDDTFAQVMQRLLENHRRAPGNAAALLHLLANQVVDGLLTLRDPLEQRLETLQNRLLDPTEPFDDWRPLLRLRSRLRWLAGRMEGQRTVFGEWREQTALALDEGTAIRFNDLDEHLGRVQHQAEVLLHDIDGLVNIHFASNAQSTNRVIQVLTVVSAVFLPLNLIAGIFGMNFDTLPLLHLPWAGWGVIATMLGGGLLLLWWFRRRRWM